jgi:D-aminopeptidase
LFLATVEATEEAVYNSMFKAGTVESNERKVEALPLDRVLPILRERKAIQ